MRRTLLSTLAVAILLGASSACPAQETPPAGLKPLVTVSFAGYDELRGDVEFIGKLLGNDKLVDQLEAQLRAMTQGPAAGPGPVLPGLDTTKPWGAVVQTDGQGQFSICGFIPVTDLKQLVALAKDPMTKEPLAKLVDGVYHVQTDGPTLFVQEKGGWAFIVNDLQHLANVPADPLKALGGLNKKYDLAVRGSVKNVPPMYRMMATSLFEEGLKSGMPQMPGESDEDYAIRQGLAKQGLQQFSAMVDDLDEVLLGVAVDRQAGTSYLDVEVTALPGTKTAAQLAGAGPTSTNFAGFNLPGAAVTGNFTGALSDSDVAEAKKTLADVRPAALEELKNQGLSDEDLQLASQLLSELLDVFESTIENKKADGGMVLVLKPNALTFVAGAAIADGAKLEKVAKQLAARVQKDDPNFGKMLKLDAETHQGIRFHTLAIPTSEMNDPTAAKMFGQTLEVVLGISETSVHVAFGRDAAGTLKQVIDQSKAQPNKAVPPMRLAVAATPIAQFVATVAEDGDPAKQMATMIAGLLGQTGGKDHVILTSKPIPNGASMRLEIEQGIIKLIGSLGPMLGGMGGPPVPGFPGEAAPADVTPF